MAYTLKNEAESFPKTLMTIYQETWHHIPLDPHQHLCENIISHRFGFYSTFNNFVAVSVASFYFSVPSTRYLLR